MIKFPDGYVIDSDTYGFVVGIPSTTKVTNKETGVERDQRTWKNERYCPSISLAIRSYRKIKQRELIANGDYTLSEAIAKLAELDKTILGQVAEYGFVAEREA